MITPLNDKLKYYKRHVESPTRESLIEIFENLGVTNNYGGIMHALVNFNFDREWVLKVLELLFQNNVDLNLQGEATGYSYIHLALYGYTDSNGNDHSYDTNFIVSLINLGKKYGFNVNIQDYDGDTIVHTAIASEVYTGKIAPIILALGDGFNIHLKDNDGRDIKAALDYYIKIAVFSGNVSWAKRLKDEKKSIISLIEDKDKLDNASDSSRQDKVNENVDVRILNFESKYQNKLAELKELFKDATLYSLGRNLEKIKRLFEFFRVQNDNGKIEINLDPYFQDYISIVKRIVLESIEKNKKKPRKQDGLYLIELISFFRLGLEDAIEEICKRYNNNWRDLESSLEAATTINMIDKALELLNAFDVSTDLEKEYIDEEITRLQDLKSILENLINSINSGLKINGKLKDWLKEYSGSEVAREKDATSADYLTFTEKELNHALNVLNLENDGLKRRVLTIVKRQVREVFKSLKGLKAEGIISDDNINGIIEEAYKRILKSSSRKKPRVEN